MTGKETDSPLRSIPGVDQVLIWPGVEKFIQRYNRALIAGLIRGVLLRMRDEIRRGAVFQTGPDGKVVPAVVIAGLEAELESIGRPSLRRVVNATGIILHTNLGRAPMSTAMLKALERITNCYTNLEYDLVAGERGSRHAHLSRIIRAVTGAESGVVVNNNAAAVLLVLNTLASGKEVIVSRGELVEIGGSFRIPDIIGRGFAKLREVGTTNKTRLADYQNAIGPETALLLKVHTSNYKVIGFTQSVALHDLVELGRMHKLPVMEDLGSGLLMDLSGTSLAGEPTVAQSVAADADVITFSGDKLLAGPQAGFIVGKKEIIEQVKKNPLMRAVRVDKMTILALEELLRGYIHPASLEENNIVALLIRRSSAQLKSIAEDLKQKLSQAVPDAAIDIKEDVSYVGGGSLPEEAIPTWMVTVAAADKDAGELSRAFRLCPVPVVGRIKQGTFCLDTRTILPGDIEDIVAAAKNIFTR